MAMSYQNFASLGVNLNRQKYGPLDISNVFTSAADLKYYLTKGTFTEGVSEYWYKNANEKIVPYPYEGQVLATVIDGIVEVFVLALDAEGNFETREIAGKIEVDGTTIVKDADGKLSIVAPTNPDSAKTYNFAYANGVYSWVEVDTATAAGQAQAIAGLTDRTVALEEAIHGKGEGEEHVAGLSEKVAALEAVDNATQAELDAYKEVVTSAIAAGVKEAKEYADAQDADTVYDDTDVKARIKAIEDDYLKEADKYDDTDLKARVKAIEDDYLTKADKYDDTALAGRVTTAEGKIADLEAAVEAIDFVDDGELTTALEPYAKTTDVESGLALKADKTALEALQGTVDAFLTGTGTEAALDSLKELIAYIDEHDDVELSTIISDIEALQAKVDTGDQKVSEYVAAAIAALKIGDYAKAADLTALAGRVEALEAKPFDTYATKAEVQGVDAKFASYTTTSDLTNLLADKADADSVVANNTFETFKSENTTAIGTAKSEAVAAAKAETESQVGVLESAVAETYATKDELTEAVDGIENDLLAYAKTADVNAGLAKKIETATISHATEDKAEGVIVNGTQLDIVVDAYTKAETLAQIEEIMDKITDNSDSAASVAVKLDNHITAYTEKVGQIDAKDAAQDTAIAAAQTQADKGVADAKKVSDDLAAANIVIGQNTNEINVVKGTITTVNETLSGKVTALENKDIEIAGQISSLDTTIKGHTTTITEHGTKLTALENEDARLAALIQGNIGKFADYYTKGEVDAAVQGAIDQIPAVDFTPYAKVTDVEAIFKAGVDGAGATGVLAEEIARAKAAEEANANAISAIVGEDSGKTIREIASAEAKAEVAALVGEAPEALDTIHEIASWIKNDETGAAAMSAEIAEHSGILTGFGGEGQPSTVMAAIATAKQEAIDAIPALAIATAEVLGGVKSSAAENKVAVGADGTMEVNSMNVNKLTQTEGDTLVLNGGNASVKAAE